MENGMFARMCREAAEELASGDQGWRDCNPNVMLLACFHLLTNHLSHTIARPLWWAAGFVGGAVVLFMIKTFKDWLVS